jgi:N-acetylmuramoyl-L-alanine amidase CwlA
MCVNSDGDFQRTIDRTAVLVADICTRRNIPMENIRQHFNWSGKNCPQNIRAGRPHGWDVFLDKVKAAMEPAPPAPPPASTPSGWAREAWEWAVANNITDGTNPQGTPTREQAVQLIFNYHRRVQSAE